jgi:hypothetical protein
VEGAQRARALKASAEAKARLQAEAKKAWTDGRYEGPCPRDLVIDSRAIRAAEHLLAQRKPGEPGPTTAWGVAMWHAQFGVELPAAPVPKSEIAHY